MSKEVAKKEEAQLPMELSQHPIGGELIGSDVQIPSLWLMQALSDFVQEDKAKQGDIVRSTTGEKLGGGNDPVQFIPILIQNSWLNTERVGQKDEWRGITPRTAVNEFDPWNYQKNGGEWKRTKAISVFSLLVKDVAAYEEAIKSGEIDVEKTVIPVVIQFKSTGFQAGRTVTTFIAKVRQVMMTHPMVRPWQYQLPLTSRKDKNEKGHFFVYEVGKSSKVPESYAKLAEDWYKQLEAQVRAGTVKVHDGAGEGPETASNVGDQF